VALIRRQQKGPIMSMNFAKAFLSSSLPVSAVRIVLAGLTVASFALCLTPANAADQAQQPVTYSSSTFGSGPMMVSILDSARREGPVRGVETTTVAAQPVYTLAAPRPQQAAPTQLAAAR
jgi:hypothetical protein